MDWHPAVDDLLAKGYQKTELARILCEAQGCNVRTAKEYFMKKHRPPLHLQQAIIELNTTLHPKPGFENYQQWIDFEGDYVGAIERLLAQGYLKSQLARMLAEKTGCSANTAAREWLTLKYTPPLRIQYAIVQLEEELT